MSDKNRDWSASFCGCFSEIDACLFVFLCPMIGIGCLQCCTRNTYHGDGGTLAYLCHCCLGFYGNAYNRTQLRSHYNINGNYFVDCLIYGCCLGLCGSVQEYAEVKIRSAKKT
mmetsp:Transcript_27332/g.49163  ORF Transcript_27332/g.49163 Transcript_27332/m.49163 type:complete len:113 (+) Transcript_27332:165-503(+)